jgi:hypothetical protein
MPSTVQLIQEKEEQKKSFLTPAEIGRRIGSIRVSYTLMIALICWFLLALLFYVLQVVGAIAGR